MNAHQLEALLAQLKLHGMAECLPQRLAQATAGELGHTQLLEVLCQDEIARRDATGLARRVKAARFEQTAAIEDYDFNFNPTIPAAQIRDLATLRFVEAGESVILHGPVGVGKTMIAQALGHLARRRGHTVAFTKTSVCWPTSPAGTPTAPGTPGCGAGPAPPCSSSTTSRSASSPSPKPTTSTTMPTPGLCRLAFERALRRKGFASVLSA